MTKTECRDLRSLFQAFELTGRRIFQNKWTGHEAFSVPSEDAGNIGERRKEIETELVKLLRRDEALQNLVETNPSKGERDHIRAQSEEIWEARDRLRAELNALPEVSDGHQETHESWNRRIEIENRLREGFQDGKLTLLIPPSGNVNYKDWILKDGFRISFAFSLIIPPRGARRQQRRFPAYVDQWQLETWLDRFASDSVSAGELTAEEKCGLWLASISNDPATGKVKSDYRAAARSMFPQLSTRAFERAWASSAPESWKIGGPKR